MKSAVTAIRQTGLPALFAWGLVLNMLLVAPLWLRFGFGEGRWLALEAWALVGLFAVLPDRLITRGLRWLVVLVLILALVLGLGDGATYQVLSRPLNVYFDINLLSASFNLLDGNLGRIAALGIFAVALALLTGLGLVLARALQPGQVTGPAPRRVAMLLALSAMILGGLETQGQRPAALARVPVWDTLSFQLKQIGSTHRARAAFVEAAPATPRPATALTGLADTDVLLVFIESYGATVLDLDRYRDIVVPTLERMQAQLGQAGLSMATGLLEAPIRGGQSWLAHATLLSGRWIDNQLWYRLLLESHHNNLIDDFRATGHQTIGVMPAITMPWPEGRQLGLDRIYAARQLNYAGPPLNWVTMPDQYTLHHFQSVLRPQVTRPLFAKIALISSHAPWTPILEVEADWEAIGDGSSFERWRNAGDPPQVLWQDIERVRDHFAHSVEYSLNVSLEFAARFLDDRTLLILLGDHQPAALITGHEASGAVPIHVIARDPALIEPFRRRGFAAGLIADYPSLAPGMDRFRGWLHEDFGPEKNPAPGSRAEAGEPDLNGTADAQRSAQQRPQPPY